MPENAADAELLADALVAIGRAHAREGEIAGELSRVVELVQAHPEVRRFLSDVAVAPRGKWEALTELLGDTVSPDIFHFVMMLVENGELVLLERIRDRAFERLSRRHDRLAGKLVTARGLTDEAVAAIEQELGRILGMDVELRVRVDESLIGGMRVEVGSFVLDGTIDRQLESIRKQLLV